MSLLKELLSKNAQLHREIEALKQELATLRWTPTPGDRVVLTRSQMIGTITDVFSSSIDGHNIRVMLDGIPKEGVPRYGTGAVRCKKEHLTLMPETARI